MLLDGDLWFELLEDGTALSSWRDNGIHKMGVMLSAIIVHYWPYWNVYYVLRGSSKKRRDYASERDSRSEVSLSLVSTIMQMGIHWFEITASSHLKNGLV